MLGLQARATVSGSALLLSSTAVEFNHTLLLGLFGSPLQGRLEWGSAMISNAGDIIHYFEVLDRTRVEEGGSLLVQACELSSRPNVIESGKRYTETIFKTMCQKINHLSFKLLFSDVLS